MHFAWLGLVFWIELKTTKNNSVRLSPQQIAWNTAYSRNGGLSFILVKHLSSGDLILFEGAQSLEIGRNGLRSGSLFRGSGHQAMWDQVREAAGDWGASTRVTATWARGKRKGGLGLLLLYAVLDLVDQGAECCEYVPILRFLFALFNDNVLYMHDDIFFGHFTASTI